jgi:hypothetical protein
MGDWRYSSTHSLDGGEVALPPGERHPGTRWLGGWVGPACPYRVLTFSCCTASFSMVLLRGVSDHLPSNTVSQTHNTPPPRPPNSTCLSVLRRPSALQRCSACVRAYFLSIRTCTPVRRQAAISRPWVRSRSSAYCLVTLHSVHDRTTNERWAVGESEIPGKKTCSSATFSISNPTWPDLGSNPGRRGGKQATNCLSCGGAIGKFWVRCLDRAVSAVETYSGSPAFETLPSWMSLLWFSQIPPRTEAYNGLRPLVRLSSS